MLPETVYATTRAALPASLQAAFDAQVAVVGPFVQGLVWADARGRLADAMTQVFVQSYGVPAELAPSLAQVATTPPPAADEPTATATAVARCALQRALVMQGLGAQLRPGFCAAARGAADGLDLDERNVVFPAASPVEAPAARPVMRVPLGPAEPSEHFGVPE